MEIQPNKETQGERKKKIGQKNFQLHNSIFELTIVKIKGKKYVVGKWPNVEFSCQIVQF